MEISVRLLLFFFFTRQVFGRERQRAADPLSRTDDTADISEG